MTSCDFDKFCSEPCNKTVYKQKSEILKFDEFDECKKEVYLWRSGATDDVKTICSHHEVYFGNKFEQRSSNQKCCNVLKCHTKLKKVKG